MSQTNINPLVKQALMSVYMVFADICEKQHLKYWLGYGTMLGAVRHQGFIPWDDDFDVFMLREDYERFMAVCGEIMPSYYKLVSIQNCSDYPANFCKIQETRRDVYEMLERNVGYVNPHGIYIDIFPLDGVPEGLVGKSLDFLRFASAFCRTSYLWRGHVSGNVGRRLFKFVGRCLGIFYRGKNTRRDFGLLYEKWMKETIGCECRKVRICNVERRFQSTDHVFPLALFDETVLVKFENVLAPIPKMYDMVLKCLYGNDYMTPPPVRERISEHSKELDCPWKYGPNKC